MRSDDPAAAHVQELIDGFWPIHVLTALAKLQVPEALAAARPGQASWRSGWGSTSTRCSACCVRAARLACARISAAAGSRSPLPERCCARTRQARCAVTCCSTAT